MNAKQLIERDDINSLPLPASAKRYARRKGLAAMKRQPQDYINMVADLTNQKKRQYGFSNTSAAETTSGKKIQ